MRRIGITQRVESAAGHGERRDCLDQRWGRLLASRGFIPVPLCNEVEDVARYVEALALDGVILVDEACSICGHDVTWRGVERVGSTRDT